MTQEKWDHAKKMMRSGKEVVNGTVDTVKGAVSTFEHGGSMANHTLDATRSLLNGDIIGALKGGVNGVLSGARMTGAAVRTGALAAHTLWHGLKAGYHGMSAVGHTVKDGATALNSFRNRNRGPAATP